MSRGGAVVYFDGLDEIFDGPRRGAVVEEIAAFAVRYPQVRIIVTSRIIGYEPEWLRSAGFSHATLEDFDDGQVTDFLERWHLAAEEDPKERARLRLQMQSALENSRAVRELAANPLLLTMTAMLNRTQPLPRNRVEVYEQASRVLLQEWDTSRSLPPDDFSRQEKDQLLRELAGEMQRSEGGLAANLIDRTSLIRLFRNFLQNLGIPDPYAEVTSLINRLVERNFILCYAGADRFSFVHRAFLDYYCAGWFVELLEKKQVLTLEALKQDVFGSHWRDERWHEVLRLIAGMLGAETTAEIIRFLMRLDGSADRVANIILAAECLGEVRNRHAIRQTSEQLRHSLIETAVQFDPAWISHPLVDYDNLVTTREKAVHILAAVWHDDATRDWMRRNICSDTEDWVARRAALVELARAWKEDAETLPLLKERAGTDKNWAVRQAAVLELVRGWKADAETLPLLIELARTDQHSDVRKTAVSELARGWQDNAETLPLLKERVWADEHGDVRRAALQELVRGWKDDAEVLPLLKERARTDGYGAVRQVAAQELARGWKDDAETLPSLKELARNDDDSAVRQTAVQALAHGWTADLETGLLLEGIARSDSEPVVRRAAVRGLPPPKDISSAVVWCAQHDTDSAVRREAVRRLQTASSEFLIRKLLIDIAERDPSSEVRRGAVLVLLRHLDDPSARSRLLVLAKTDSSELVRRQINSALDSRLTPWTGWLRGHGPEGMLPELLSDYPPQVTVQWVRIRDIRAFHDSGPVFVGAKGTLLVGENGAGKSTLARAIVLVALGVELANQVEVRPASYLRRGATVGYMEVVFHHGAGPDDLVNEFTVGLEIRQGELSFRPIPDANLTLGNKNCAERLDLLRRRDDDEFGFFCGYGAHRVFADPAGILPQEPKVLADRVISLFRSVSPVVHPDVVERLLNGDLSNIREAPPSLPSDTLIDMRCGMQQLLPGLTLNGIGEAQVHECQVGLMDLSDGYASMVALLGHLFRHSLGKSGWKGSPSEIHGVLVVDELDAHLHPEWQRRILPDLRTVFPNLQIIATSHSPMIVGSAEPGSIRLLKPGGGPFEVVSDLPSVAGWRADQILTSVFFDLRTTRNTVVEDLLARYADALAESGPEDPTVRELGPLVAKALEIEGEGVVERKTHELLEQVLLDRFKSLDGETRRLVLARAGLVLGGQ